MIWLHIIKKDIEQVLVNNSIWGPAIALSLWVSYFMFCRDSSCFNQHCGYKPVKSSPFRWVTPPGGFCCLGILMVGFFVFLSPFWLLLRSFVHALLLVLYACYSCTPPLLLYLFYDPHLPSSECDMRRASFCEHRNTPLYAQGGQGSLFSSVSFWGLKCVCVCVCVCFLAEWHRIHFQACCYWLALLMSHQHQTACGMRWRKHSDKHALIRKPNVHQ